MQRGKVRLDKVRGNCMVIGVCHLLRSVEELAVEGLRVHLGELLGEEPQGKGARREVPRREARHPPLEYRMDTIGKPTIPKMLVRERLGSAYGVEVLSTRSLIVHSLVMPNQLTDQTLNWPI